MSRGKAPGRNAPRAIVIARALVGIMLVSSAMGVLTAQSSGRKTVESPPIRQYPVLTDRRMELLKEYAKAHFGAESAALDSPGMIVVHYTELANLADSLATFKPDTLPRGRTDIAGHGDVNVGVHYVIAKDGTVDQLQPENVIGRHTIGFNWCAIGIEMVARNEKELTDAELLSCATLCAWIASRHPSIEYLIGHHEYVRKDLPHFALYLEKDAFPRPFCSSRPPATATFRGSRRMGSGYHSCRGTLPRATSPANSPISGWSPRRPARRGGSNATAAGWTRGMHGLPTAGGSSSHPGVMQPISPRSTSPGSRLMGRPGLP
jgi:hypothetical protein